jgi:transposase
VSHGRVENVDFQYETIIRYPLRFRQQIVDLVHAGLPIPELVQQFGCTATTIHNWLRLERRQEQKLASCELTINEHAELEQLRRENRRLLMEREILSKGRAAWVAQDSRQSSKRSADS